MRVRGGDYEAFARDAVLGQTRSEFGGEGGGHTAVVQRHHGDGLFAANDHCARPKFAVDAFMLAVATSVTGEHHWMLGRHVSFCHAHRTQAHAAHVAEEVGHRLWGEGCFEAVGHEG